MFSPASRGAPRVPAWGWVRQASSGILSTSSVDWLRDRQSSRKVDRECVSGFLCDHQIFTQPAFN